MPISSILGVDVIGDIRYVFVKWHADNIDHGNTTCHVYGTVHDMMKKCLIPSVNITIEDMAKYIYMFLH